MLPVLIVLMAISLYSNRCEERMLPTIDNEHERIDPAEVQAMTQPSF